MPNLSVGSNLSSTEQYIGDGTNNSNLAIGTDGKTGVGTTDPRADLHVKDSVNGDVSAYVENADSNGASAYSVVRVGELTSSIQKSINMEYHNAGLSANGNIKPLQGAISTGSSATNGMMIATQANAPIVFVTNGWTTNERMRIDGTGNLGVGTSSPAISDGTGVHIAGKILRIATSKSPTSGSNGNPGEICWDSNYIYVCVALNVWKRAALSGY
jgi:hypothetical protein